MRILLALTTIALILAGCGGQGEIDPIPTPMQKPDETRIFLSASQARRAGEAGAGSDGMVAIVGLPGAVDPVARVVVEDPEGAFAIESVVREDGSFATALPLAAGDRVRIYARLRAHGAAPVDGPAVERQVPPAEKGINPDPPATVIQNGQGAGGPAIRATVRDDGTVELRAAIRTVDAGVDVVIGNTRNGALVVTAADAEGAFEAAIAGERGDVLVLFARWQDAAPGAPEAPSEAITFRID